MSPRELARDLALRRSEGQLDNVVEVLADGTPADLRAYLQAFYVLQDSVAAEREQLAATDAPLSSRMVVACIHQEIVEAIETARSMLSQIARNRGRPGTPGCRGGAPAVMGHGCPAFAGSPSGGPVSGWTRAEPLSGLDITTNADPLFAGREVQELPGGKCRDNLKQDREIMQ